MRTIGLDVHKRFAEAAILEPGQPLKRRRIRTTPTELRAFIDELSPQDQVVLEASLNTWQLADLLRTRAGRVVVSNPMKTKAIASAKIKTDKVDAEVLARLLAADFVAEVWIPDAELRALRRLLAHRLSLVRQRTQLRNRIHAVLIRNFLDCPFTDLFGKSGQRWLAQQPMPVDERTLVDATVRLLVSIESELAAVERPLAECASADPRVQRLITIPGVGMVTALALVAVIGDIHRFPRPTQLAGYLGLDPRVRQSGERPAHLGHISRQGQSHARGLLVEAAMSAVRQPGPLRAFHQRIRARRRGQIAIVAVARKLAVFAWHLLTHETEYRWAPRSLTSRKRAVIERQAGRAVSRSIVPPSGDERAVLQQAEHAYRMLVQARQKEPDAAASNGKRSLGRRPDARQGFHSNAPVFSTRVDRVQNNLTNIAPQGRDSPKA
ncbi:MAG TPA: IS110 family transposase [Candidatus Dormibacteraeota bacterium]